MNKRGIVLFETVISIGFISIILLSTFVIINSILNRNNKLYDDQIERKTINSVYSKIANDLYRYNISSYGSNDSTYCGFLYYTTDVNNPNTKQLKVTEDGLEYGNEIIKNNSAVKFDSIWCNHDEDMLKLIITYNDDKTMDIYSINYKGI